MSRFCSDEEVSVLLAFAQKNGDKFQINPVGPYRKYLTYDSELCPEIYKIKLALATYYKITDFVQDPMLNDFIGIVSDGGFVHEHRDSDKLGRIHIRINCLLQKPVSGGILLSNEELIPLEEKECWLNFASRNTHGTSKVIGDRPRIVSSFGYQVQQKMADAIYERFNG